MSSEAEDPTTSACSTSGDQDHHILPEITQTNERAFDISADTFAEMHEVQEFQFSDLPNISNFHDLDIENIGAGTSSETKVVPDIHEEDNDELEDINEDDITYKNFLNEDFASSLDEDSNFDPGSRFHSRAPSIDYSEDDPHSGMTSRMSNTVDETEIDCTELELLEADDIDQEQDIPVSFVNALILNESYRTILSDFIESLEIDLKENTDRQDAIEDELDSLRIPKVDQKQKPKPDISSRRTFSAFSVPYFKDAHGFTHPPNEVTLRKRKRDELDTYISVPSVWSEVEKEKLLDAVREDALRKLKRSNRELERDYKQVKLSDDALFGDNNEDFDWMRISAQTFESERSAKSCELMWKNVLHPNINKSGWTSVEDKKLVKLVNENGTKGTWDLIATKLETNRTGFLCFQRYMQKHYPTVIRQKWTTEEDRKLRSVVEHCRINEFIPWTKVSANMENRTREQCYQRYTQSIRVVLRRGAFSEAEDFMISVGAKLFGEHNWSRISDFMPHRTPSQLNSRYNTFVRFTFDSWSIEDDRRLLQLVQVYGTKDWTKIAECFESKSKTRIQCRNRFYLIFRNYQKNPSSFSLNNLKVSSLQRRRQIQLKRNLDATLKEFYDSIKMSKDVSKISLEEGYHETPDGVRIPWPILYEFMEDLKSRLPGLKEDPEELERFNSNISSAAELGLYQPKLKKVQTLSNGKVKVFNKNVPHREENVRMKRVNRQLQNAFTPTWIDKRKARKSIGERSEDEFKILGQNLSAVMTLLKCDRSLDFSKLDSASFDDSTFTLLKYYVQNKDKLSNSELPQDQTTANAKPQVKTYSRKKKILPNVLQNAASNCASTSSSQPSCSLYSSIPPCHDTLVGFRGLLLLQRRLRLLTSEDQRPQRSGFDDLLAYGLHSPEIMQLASESKSRRESEIGSTSKVADELLYERIKALFFWPSVMANISPHMSQTKGLFKGSKDNHQLSAETPLDATTIIEEARQMSPPKKRPKVLHTANSCNSTLQ